MNQVGPILLFHYQKYPLMQVEDFLKLIHQSTYGPRHHSSSPSFEQIKKYMIEEISDMHYYPHISYVEDIGGGYVRVSLESIRLKPMLIDDLSNAFLQSMECPIGTDDDFLKKIERLKSFIEDQVIKLPYHESIKFINEYLLKGIRAIHHSDLYRKHYHPHYRVIHHSQLLEVMKEEIR